MIWRILPHATLCIASSRLILLDIRRDRYLRIPDAIAPAMRGWLEGNADSLPGTVQRMLADSGIVREGDPVPTNMLRDTVRIPSELSSPTWMTAGTPAKISGVVVSQFLTRFGLRMRSLESLLRDHIHVASARRPIDHDRLEQRCAAFARARIYSPLSRNCLLDSLSLDRWLGDDARDCRIVFGVTAHPFAAHCWLQSARAVLNDSYDHVSRHTPILAV